ncbi:MAG: BsuPI-related putative proteinase inhibitor [Actinomycetota bacterium]
MSDPFERLRNPNVSSVVPDVASLKARARRIERRRQMVLGSGAMAVAIVAVIGIAIGTARDTTQIALERKAEPTETAAAAMDQATAGQGAPSPSVDVQEFADTSTAGGASADRAAPETQESGASAVASTKAPPLEATIGFKEATLTSGTQFTLKVCNTSPDVVKRTFATSQRYDFEVKRGGDVIWRWSDGRMFTQVVGQETWKLNECKTWTEEWSGTTSAGALAAQGEYQTIGVLKTSPEMRSKAKSFCFGSC